MSKSYKKAIDNLHILSLQQALDVCLDIAKSSPSVFNNACSKVLVDTNKIEMDREVRILIEEDSKIQAIKLVRNKTGMTLRDAKAYVDNFK